MKFIKSASIASLAILSSTSVHIQARNLIGNTRCENPRMMFSECAVPKGCDMTCDMVLGRTQPVVCSSVCEARCACPDGLFLMGENCVSMTECKSLDLENEKPDLDNPEPEIPKIADEQPVEKKPEISVPEIADEQPVEKKPEIAVKCANGMTFNECHTSSTCDRSCESILGLSDPVVCVKKCESRCACPYNMATVDGKCLSVDECQARLNTIESDVELAEVDFEQMATMSSKKSKKKKSKKKNKKNKKNKKKTSKNSKKKKSKKGYAFGTAL